MPDEPTIGELVRRLEAVHADLKEDLHQLATRLDGKVSADVLALQQKAQDDAAKVLADRVKAIEEEAKAAARQRSTDRRLILTALVVPVLLVFLQAYLTAQGAS